MIYMYGASDDLFEVEGDICEEFSIESEDSSEGFYAGSSDGTVVKVTYDGVWRISPVAGHGAGILDIDSAYEDERPRETLFGDTVTEAARDFPAYSDVARISAPVRWIVVGRLGR